MSVNIQTANGLIKISGDKVTKQNVINALGYTPADVEELPEIVDDASDSLVITDTDGNIGTRINGEGIQTIEDVTIKNSTNTYSVVDHIRDTTKHITAAERAKWDNKSDFSGSYIDLADKPNISEDNSGMIQVADDSGNIILQVDDYGVTTHDVKVNNSTESVASHHNNKVYHITAAERTTWNNKSDFSGNYTELTGKPNIHDDESGELNIADSSGNVIFRAGSDGVRTYEVIVGPEIATIDQPVYEVGAELKTHADTIASNKELFDTHAKDILSNVSHITQAERTKWNTASSTAELINSDYTTGTEHEALKATVTSHIGDTTHLQEGERNKWNSAKTIVDKINEDYATGTSLDSYKTTVADTYETIANVDKLEAVVDSHVKDTIIHITNNERKTWNGKSNFSGHYTDLVGAPDIQGDNSGELNIIDRHGNIIVNVSESGIRSYNVIVGTGSLESPVLDVSEQLKTLQTHIGEFNHLSATVNEHIDDDTHLQTKDRDKWNSAHSHISDTTKHITATERSNWNALIATHESDVNSINRKLIEIGDLKEVESSFVTNYTISSGKASATVEAHMFENFYIHPTDTYNVSVTYDEWAGTVCEQRILAENTGAHIVTVSRKDGADVTSSELNTIKTIVEHIKTGFSIYFNKLYNIVQGNNDILESDISFDTTVVVAQE